LPCGSTKGLRGSTFSARASQRLGSLHALYGSTMVSGRIFCLVYCVPCCILSYPKGVSSRRRHVDIEIVIVTATVSGRLEYRLIFTHGCHCGSPTEATMLPLDCHCRDPPLIQLYRDDLILFSPGSSIPKGMEERAALSRICTSDVHVVSHATKAAVSRHKTRYKRACSR
jgi:hypothetical protein